MNTFKCDYCDSIQSTKGHLARHQKTSKACIGIQESKGVFTNKVPTCTYCKKEFYALKLKNHEAICPYKIPPPNITNITIENFIVNELPKPEENDEDVEDNHEDVEDNHEDAEEKSQEVSVKPKEYIYCLIEREFLKSGETIYKVGKSTKLFNRINHYPKGSEIICFSKVKDCYKAEKELISLLDSNVSRAPDIGREYYNCDIKVLLEYFHKVSINNY
jgi:hypothetical protein